MSTGEKLDRQVVTVTIQDIINLIYSAHSCHCTHEQDHHCYHYSPREGHLECCHCGLQRPMLGNGDPDMSLADWQYYYNDDNAAFGVD